MLSTRLSFLKSRLGMLINKKKNLQVMGDSFGTANCKLFKIQREIEQAKFFDPVISTMRALRLAKSPIMSSKFNCHAS